MKILHWKVLGVQQEESKNQMMDSLTRYMDNQISLNKSLSESTELDQDRVDLGYMNLICD